ncbi:MAG: flagellar hook capping FlgD N-terminal domain-containing protein [Terracidiphilus sp.]
MQGILANYMSPTNLSAMMPPASSGPAKAASARTYATTPTGTSSSSNSSSSSAGGLGTTFLSLLAQELQNQDPTAPVDPTEMVGQMISLNQLEQLISINQNLTPSTTSSTTTPTPVATKADATQAALASTIGSATNMLSPSAAGAATSQLPFDPNTMMPLGFANSGAVAASINSSLNPVTMGYSGSTSNASGGK